MKKRRLMVRLDWVDSSTSWSKSTLRVTQSDAHNRRKEVVICIESPSDVQEIREHLNRIVKHWHDRMDGL